MWLAIRRGLGSTVQSHGTPTLGTPAPNTSASPGRCSRTRQPRWSRILRRAWPPFKGTSAANSWTQHQPTQWVEGSAGQTWIESVRPAEYVALPSQVRATAGWGGRSGVPDTSG